MATRETVTEILDGALSKTIGPPLPYPPSYQFDLRNQIIDFIQAFPRTIPLKIGHYVTNDGVEHKLLQLDGVIHIHYKQSKYNLPMVIWLPLKFPVDPPVAYVKRGSQFIFNPRCTIVDASQDGRISTDYLRKWRYPSSNLIDFVQDLRIHFATTPPLFQKPPTTAPPLQQNLQQHNTSSVTFNPLSPNNTSNNVTLSPSMSSDSNHSPSSSPWNRPTTTVSSSGATDLGINMGGTPETRPSPVQVQVTIQEANRQQRHQAYAVALNAGLTARLQGALEAMAQVEKEKQLKIQAELRNRGIMMDAEIERLRNERDGLDRAALELTAAQRALDTWLAQNERRTSPSNIDINPDEAIVASDSLSRQLLASKATEMATDDALVAIQEAFEAKKIRLPEYLSHVRAISRKQYVAKALAMKIEAKQVALSMAQLHVGSGGTVRDGISSSNNSSSNTATTHVGMSSPLPAVQPIPTYTTDPTARLFHVNGNNNNTTSPMLNPLAAAAHRFS